MAAGSCSIRPWRGWPVAAPAIWVAAAVLLLALFMPKADDGGCIRRAELGLGITLVHNCDSNHIVRDARSLTRYVADHSPSRSRPVYIFALAAVTAVLSPVLLVLTALLTPLLPWTGPLMPFYLGAIVLNALVLALAWRAMVHLVGAGSGAVAGAALMGVVVSYDVTLAWFWVPHQILMNLLAPLGAIVAFVTGMRSPFLSVGARVLLGLASAAASLTYGYCLVWPILFGLGLLWGHCIARGREASVRDLGALLVVISPYALATCLPVLAWVSVFAAAGSEIAFEAQSFGQFRWLPEAIRDGTVMRESVERIWHMGWLTAGYLGVYGGHTIGAAALLAGMTAWTRPGLRVLTEPVIVGALATLVVMLAFNFLQGFHRPRLLFFPLLLAQVVLLRLVVVRGSPQAVVPVAGLIAAVQVLMGLIEHPISLGDG